MKIDIPYNGQTTATHLGSKQILSVIQPASTIKARGYTSLRTALKEPLKSESIKEFLSRDPLIIVNDASRATPTAEILQALHSLLVKRKPRFIVSTGTHRPPTPDELSRIFGRSYEAYREKIWIHDCQREDELMFLGRTRFGTEVHVNRHIVEADCLLIIGSVEPHYFAGYTGGRKSLIPGLAGYRTVEQNHRWALSPDSKPLCLEGNPVHDDLMEAIALLGEKKIFSVQVVLESEGRIYAAFAGDMEATFRKAVEAANRVYVTELEEKAEVVVAVAASPLDANLYQAHKAIEHGKLALKRGGTIILVAACPEGIGPRHFYDMLTSIRSRAEIPAFLEKSKTTNYTLGLHKAAKIAELLLTSEIWAMTEMPDDVLQRIHIRPVHHLQKGVEEALRKHGSKARAVILADGATCVPQIRKQGLT